ncbi:MAG: lytic transglycosylase domain-containing protein [Gammaproteobacteria bacterium]|nr:lytic transglycosylase domain-containing protein [Gammaproteobacteria bacterium]MBU0848945.1 lytic transglycosylase domain-containing protein [Gammaproteobacteria bacterium]MBU1268243.1 lytic transglycosylase domain-containing protein [Gammaproteobacteria bacterium]MBU1527800.1 lytic transglycosylase domain-containing protein [Gammaproteobacteria bacterium]MBU1778842.1 lytic transglycosylase domain-containing protein [Gammaproteobacteria bacterium]
MTIFHHISRWTAPPILALGLLCQPALADTQTEGELVKQIREAYSEGAYDKFTRLSSQLPQKSIFRPYVDIWQFRFFQKGMEKQYPDQEIVWQKTEVIPLLNSYENSWPAESLRRDWLEQLARTAQWEEFAEQRKLLRYRPDQGVECADLMYAAEQGQLVRYKLNAVIGFEKRLPKTCRVLLKNLYKVGGVSAQDLDKHVLHMVASNQLSNAIKFVDEFDDTAWGKAISSAALKKAIFNPETYLKSPAADASTDLYLASALTRRAVDDFETVARQIEQTYAGKLSPASEQWLWAHVGYRAGLVWNRDALSYFRRSNPDVMSAEQQEWKVRSALLLEDWPSVLQASNELSPPLKEDKAWVYWRGRALAANGKHAEARQEWIKASSPFSFYGKLAHEELGDTVTAPRRPELLTAAELDAAKKNPGLIRSLALYDAGLRTEGFWEFNLQVAQMNDRQLLAAATWAERNQLYDRAIAAADRTEIEHDLGLRYLTPFRDNMRAKTREVGVDESWVYGLIRQESRFVTIARSGVGASGLMQVMPATAKYVARKIGLSSFKPADITEIETNLTLGTSYLKMVFEQHDQSPVLASAGYNAGPSRPSLWKRRLGDRQIEGAIFAELIPFDETRGYVKNVMSNTVAYSLLLNNASTPLKQRLGIIYGSK